MSVRRDVVSLSQLLRRNENLNPRRGTGRAPPLSLQTSRCRTETPLSSGHRVTNGRQADMTPLVEKPTGSRHQPLSFTQCVLDASHASTSQPDSSQAGGSYPVLSQEVYDVESERLSAMTSMSQSSFSQSQSQNLLGPDDQLHQLQQWQTQQALPTVSPSPVCCNGNEKLNEIEQSLTRAFAEQTCEQKQQQQELMTRLVSPINKSVKDIMVRLTACGKDQKKQEATIKKLTDGVNNVTTTVLELRDQSCSSKDEILTAVIDEAALVKATITSLQARVESVENSVKSCSTQIAEVREVTCTKHEVLLSAVAASSCNCPQDATFAEALSGAERPTKKRRPNPGHIEAAEKITSRHAYSSETSSPARVKDQSPVRRKDNDRARIAENAKGMHDGSLQLALQRIEALRTKRRSYLRGW